MTNQDEQLTRNPDFIFRRIINETILVPVRRDLAEMDCIYTLNELGALLWEHMSAPITKSELQQLILTEFDTTEEAAAVDLDIFLEELQKIGAVLKV